MQPPENPFSLRAFLEDSNRPPGTLQYHELQGFLFAVATAPDFVPPSEWAPMIFDAHDAGYASAEEAAATVGELMRLYNSISASIFDHEPSLPATVTFRDNVLDNFEDDAPVAQWARGWLIGHQWLEDTWTPYVPDEMDEEVGSILLALSFFSSRALAEAFLKETRAGTLEELAVTIRDELPHAAADYARLGKSIQTAIMTANQEPHRSEKIGRNEPCPCGSGRKHKKCCGAP